MTVLSGFLCGLRVLGHVIANVVFEELAHQAVDGAARSGEALKDVLAFFDSRAPSFA